MCAVMDSISGEVEVRICGSSSLIVQMRIWTIFVTK